MLNIQEISDSIITENSLTPLINLALLTAILGAITIIVVIPLLQRFTAIHISKKAVFTCIAITFSGFALYLIGGSEIYTHALTNKLTEQIPLTYRITPSDIMAKDIAQHHDHASHTSQTFLATNPQGEQIEVHYQLIDHHLKIIQDPNTVISPIK